MDNQDNLMTPTPIKQLIARATKGPYTVGPDNDFTALRVADRDYVARFTLKKDAELHARLSPDTVAAVVEALENVALWASSNPTMHADIKRCAKALALLNGETAPS